MLLCQDCIDPLRIEAECGLVPLCEGYELRHCEGHIVVGEALLDHIEPS